MLHSIKRVTVGSLAVKNGPTNTQFDHSRRMLESVQKTLQTGLTTVETAKRKWESFVQDNEKFYMELSVSYPNEDETVSLIRKAADNLHTSVNSGLQSLTRPGGTHVQLMQLVRQYIAELKILKEDCSSVDKAQKDMALYSQKVDKIKQYQQLNSDAMKQERNVQKYEQAKSVYEERLQIAMIKMTRLTQKASQIFNALFVIHASFNGAMCGVVAHELKEVFQYSIEQESALTASMSSKKGKTVETLTTTDPNPFAKQSS